MEYLPPAIVILALCLGAYALRKIREAGEDITLEYERRAFEALVARNQKHAAEQAARKALEKMPSLRTELKDHRNPTHPASATWSGDWEEMR